MICYLHCTLRYKDELRVSPSVFFAAQAYEPPLSRSSIVRWRVSVFSPVILMPCSKRNGEKVFNIVAREDNTRWWNKRNESVSQDISRFVCFFSFWSRKFPQNLCVHGGVYVRRKIAEINLCVLKPFSLHHYQSENEWRREMRRTNFSLASTQKGRKASWDW